MIPSGFDFAQYDFTLQETQDDVLILPAGKAKALSIQERVNDEAVKIWDLAKKLHEATKKPQVEWPPVKKLEKAKDLTRQYVAYLEGLSLVELNAIKQAMIDAASTLSKDIEKVRELQSLQAIKAKTNNGSYLSTLVNIAKEACTRCFERNAKPKPPSKPPLSPAPPPTLSQITDLAFDLFPPKQTSPQALSVEPAAGTPKKTALEARLDELSANVQLAPFIAYVKKIPKQKNAKLVEDFCLELLGELQAGKTTQEAARKHLDRLLFLLDKRPEALKKELKLDFKKKCAFLERELIKVFKEIKEKHHPHKAEVHDIFAEELVRGKSLKRGLILENLYAFYLANMLLASDGNAYLGLIDDAKEHLLVGKTSSFDKHVLKVLDDFKGERVQKAFLRIGKVGDIGSLIIRSTFCIKKDDPITLKHVRETALAALLGRWRQVGYGACYAYSTSAVKQILAPELVLDEYNEILETGGLKRESSGREHFFFACPKMTPYVLSRKLLDNVTAETLLESPHLKYAFDVAKATKEQVNAAIASVKAANKPLTLLAIYTEMKPHLVGLSDEEFQTALFATQTLGEMALPRVWNNAISSIFFPPFTSPYPQLVTHTLFKDVIRATFGQLVDETRARKPKAMKGPFDLSRPEFQSLEKMRIFVAPPSAANKRYGECLLYKKENGTFSQITTKEQFGALLKEIFVDVAIKMKSPACAKKIGGTQEAEVADMFLSFFDERFVNDVSFDPLYDNKPWSFKLTPGYFDSFWTAYLTPQITDRVLPSAKIDFEANPNAPLELIEKLAAIRKQVGSDPHMVVPAKFPDGKPKEIYAGHALVLTPNHPTMIPKDGQTPDAMMKEKMSVVQALTVTSAKETIKEAHEWAKGYLEKQMSKKTEAEVATSLLTFTNAMQDVSSKYPALSLQTYLKTLIQKLEEVCSTSKKKHTLNFVSLDELSNHCLHGMLTDIKGAEKSIVIHFGDSMWEHEPPNSNFSLAVDICLYPNPITLEWNPVYLATTKTYGFVKPCAFPNLSLYVDVEALRSARPQKELLVETPTYRQKKLVLQDTFSKAFRLVLDAKTEVSAYDREQIQKAESLERIEEIINKMAVTPAQKALAELVKIKSEQLKDFRKQCREQLVEPNRDEVVVTRAVFDPALLAFDADLIEFIKILQKELS